MKFYGLILPCFIVVYEGHKYYGGEDLKCGKLAKCNFDKKEKVVFSMKKFSPFLPLKFYYNSIKGKSSPIFVRGKNRGLSMGSVQEFLVN